MLVSKAAVTYLIRMHDLKPTFSPALWASHPTSKFIITVSFWRLWDRFTLVWFSLLLLFAQTLLYLASKFHHQNSDLSSCRCLLSVSQVSGIPHAHPVKIPAVELSVHWNLVLSLLKQIIKENSFQVRFCLCKVGIKGSTNIFGQHNSNPNSLQWTIKIQNDTIAISDCSSHGFCRVRIRISH